MLDPRWSKVVRDLWSNKTRTLLVVLAIAVGVFAFGSVFITGDILVADMNAQYRAISPSAITFGIRSFDEGLVRWARRQKEVASAQGKAVYLVKMVGGAGDRNLDLYAVEDHRGAVLNRLALESGAWPNGRQDVMLERTSVSLARAAVGETVVVELSSGRKHELKLSGTVHDLNAIPSTLFPQLSGYVSMKTLGELGLPGTYNRLEVAARGEYDSLGKLEKVADTLKERLERAGVTVNSVQVREPDEHWARRNTQSFTLILSFIGVFSLIMSGFLVVNTISALLAEQKRQIGIMKAVGGTAHQITGVYLALVVTYGLLALVVALPVGMGLAYMFTSWVVQFLNVEIVNFHLPPRVLALQVGAALLVPVLASAIPILGGVRVTVREAVGSHGITGKSWHGVLDRLVLRVSGLPRPLLLSLRNTFRRKGRLFMTLGALSIAGTLFMTVLNVRASMKDWSDDLLKTWFNYEVSLYLDRAYPDSGVQRRIRRLPGVVQAEGRSGISVQYMKTDGTKGATFAISGLPHDTDFVQPEILSGRWLTQGDRKSVVISSALSKAMPGVHAGDSIVVDIEGKTSAWYVAGIMYMPFDKFAYGNLGYISSLKGESGLVEQVLVRTAKKDGISQSSMAKALEKRLKETGIGVGQSFTSDSLSSSWAGQFDFLVTFLMSMAAMTALVGALGLAGMMSLNVMERIREIGVMRSIGASNSMISGLVLAEGLLIGFISWALAIPLSVPMSLAFDAMLGQAFFESPLPLVLSTAGPIVWLVVVLAVSAMASLLPAIRATRISVRETLAYE